MSAAGINRQLANTAVRGRKLRYAALFKLFHLPGVHYKHLQAVFYVGKACVRVVVQGKYLDVGVFFFKALYHAAAADMVGQAAEGLEYDKGMYAP